MEFIVFLTVFFAMEFVAWFTHKYIMHGLLWTLHKDHHTRDNSGPFEKNDSFFVIFAIPAMAFIFLGSYLSNNYFLSVGFGITAYGACYFLVHDVLIHQRIKWFRKNNNFYFRSIRKAHKIHHKKMVKEDGQYFGMLIVPIRLIIEEYKRTNK